MVIKLKEVFHHFGNRNSFIHDDHTTRSKGGTMCFEAFVVQCDIFDLISSKNLHR